MTTLSDLPGIVRAVLSAGGPLSKRIPRFQESSEQLDYARRVSELLMLPTTASQKGPPTALLEAATGIGKSFGYLVPLIAYSAITQRRVAVATYTLELLYQLQKAAPLARDAIADLGVIDAGACASVTSAIRVGMPEFVAPSRVAGLLDLGHWLPAERRALELLQEHGRKGSGLIREWGHALPASVSLSDIELNSTCAAGDFALYEAHADRARGVQLVLCTQAAILLQAAGRADLVGGKTDHAISPAALVIDEADRVPDMAESIVSIQVPVRVLQRLMVEHGAKPAALRAVESMAALVVQRAQKGGRVYLTDARNRELRGEVLTSIGESLAKMKSVVTSAGEGSELDRYYQGLRRLKNILGGESSHSLPYIETSPVRAFPNIGLANANPGAVLSGLWRFDNMCVQKLLLTSATLSMGTDKSLMRFANSVGIFDTEAQLQRDLCASIQPARFGALQFVFPDPRVPKPYAGAREDEGGVHPNPAWLRYAARMVARARAEGGRVLVLVGSFFEAEALGRELASTFVDAIVQQRGAQSRLESQMAFLTSKNAVWISPSVWEGLDLPGAIQHLVIARLPHKPLTHGAASAQREAMLARGLDVRVVEGIVQAGATAATFRRLQQGIGRAIRSPRDRATIWFCDPRIGLPEPMLDALLDAGRDVINYPRTYYSAIPSRFRSSSNMDSARVLLIDQDTPCHTAAFA